MQTYLEAYRSRLEHNHNNLMEMAQELKKMGYKVKIRKDSGSRLVSTFTVYSGDKGVRVQFNTVPYRFTFEYSHKPNPNTGSGTSGKEFYPQTMTELPFTIQDVISNFRPMYIDERFESMYTYL